MGLRELLLRLLPLSLCEDRGRPGVSALGGVAVVAVGRGEFEADPVGPDAAALLRLEQPLPTVLKPDLHRARRHRELIGQRLALVKARQGVLVCARTRRTAHGEYDARVALATGTLCARAEER